MLKKLAFFAFAPALFSASALAEEEAPVAECSTLKLTPKSVVATCQFATEKKKSQLFADVPAGDNLAKSCFSYFADMQKETGAVCKTVTHQLRGDGQGQNPLVAVVARSAVKEDPAKGTCFTPVLEQGVPGQRPRLPDVCLKAK